MNFLVIDDNFLLLKTLEDYLHRMKHQCTMILDPTEVDSWIEANSCDAVVLDILMPKINGLEVISIIRKHKPDVPILVFTGIGFDDSMMQQAREAGANGYLSKGMEPSDIYLALMRLIQKPARRQPGMPHKSGQNTGEEKHPVPPYCATCKTAKIENIHKFGLCKAKNPDGCPHSSELGGEILCHHPNWKIFSAK